MKDPRVSHDKIVPVKISGFNKKYFPKDYAEQTKKDSYREAGSSSANNRDIQTRHHPKKSSKE